MDDLTGCDDHLDAAYEDANGADYSGDEFDGYADYHGLYFNYTYDDDGGYATDFDVRNADDYDRDV